MARIPTVEQQLGFEPSKRVVEGIRTPVDDGIAQGLMKLGQAGVEIAGRIQKATLDHELVKADTDLRVRLDKARQAIELDAETPDVAIPQRWKQESDKIIGEVGGTISSGRARELWTTRARGVQAEGDTWSANLQRTRQVDKVRAGYVTMAAEAEAMAGDQSISPETYATKLDGLRALNASQMASGFVDKEEGAKRQAQLDGLRAKDNQIRLSDAAEALVRAGDEVGAKELLDSVGDAATRKLVEASIKSTKNEIEAERAKAEKEVREAQIKFSNELEVGVLKGEIRSEKDIQAAVNQGQIHVNDQPALIRALREEQNRRKIEAERATKLTPEQAAELKERSQNALAYFKGMANDSRTASFFMKDRTEWSEQDRLIFEGMDGDSQRAVLSLQVEKKTAGGTQDAVSKVYADLMTEAKRWAPKEWMLGGESVDAKKRKENADMTAMIWKLAEKLAPEVGANPLQQKQAQAHVAQAFSNYDPKRTWINIPAVSEAASKDRLNAIGQASAVASGVDWELWNQVGKILGPDATTDQIMAGYRQAGGKGKP